MDLHFNRNIDDAPLNIPLLLLYNKGNSSRRGNTGAFVTQGVRKLDWYWQDYTGRDLWHSGATTSKNKIVGWILLENITY